MAFGHRGIRILGKTYGRFKVASPRPDRRPGPLQPLVDRVWRVLERVAKRRQAP